MALHPITSFSKVNQRMILLLILSHLLWSCTLIALRSAGSLFEEPSSWLSVFFVALQLYAAAQLLLPALLLHAEERNRGFYLFWGVILLLGIWLINQIPLPSSWQPLLVAFKSGLLLLVATITGAALARYVRHLWEIIPIGIAMTLADFSSWLYGPTAAFTRQLEQFYLRGEGPPPLIDMVLVKLAFPGGTDFAPVFGISDWIMVVFFAIVARRHGVNDNLLGRPGESVAQKGQIGRYLPVSVVALFVAIMLAQATGLFIPALPLIALIMLLWYGLRLLLLPHRRRKTP